MRTSLELPEADRLVLPEPTLEYPLAQVDFLFDRLGKIKPSKSENLRDALSFYKRIYLPATYNYDNELPAMQLFYVRKQWDSLAVIKLQSFLNTYNVEGNPCRLSSASVVIIVNGLRQVVKYAGTHKLTDGAYIHGVPCDTVRPETTQNSAYSDREMDVINVWLQGKMERGHKVMQASGYQRTGIGRDPRIIPLQEELGKDAQPADFGWKNPANLRWYFEQVMNCQAACKPVYHSQPHYWFYHYASQYAGNYDKLLSAWQIRPVASLDIVLPLALKLSIELGLNPTSLWDLTIDCFQEKHPLSGMPFLQYYKGRSRGHMQMHLSPYDKDATISQFKEGQANIIRKTIALIQQVTAHLRSDAPEGCSAFLFLYQHPGKNGTQDEQRTGEQSAWTVQRVTCSKAAAWCCTQVAADGLKARDGRPLQLAIGRFRSTKITDMVRRGFDFFEIQNRFGHKSILTTLKYIALNNLETRARRDVQRTLETIHDNQAWQRSAQPEYAGGEPTPSAALVYKGVLADCRNVFDPPADVKKLKDYQPAHACTRFNMCMFCNNVVIMRHHLPAMVAYQRQIRLASGDHNATELPNAQYYLRTLGVLDHILDPNMSEFSRNDLAWASAAAECLDVFIDPVVYQPSL